MSLLLSLYFSFNSYADQDVGPIDPLPPFRPRVQSGIQLNVRTRDDCLQFTTALHMFQLIFTVELVETLCNFTNNYAREHIGNRTAMAGSHCYRILQIHCAAVLYGNCRVAQPGTLLDYLAFVPWELGESLHVQEQVQADWLFSENQQL